MIKKIKIFFVINKYIKIEYIENRSLLYKVLKKSWLVKNLSFIKIIKKINQIKINIIKEIFWKIIKIFIFKKKKNNIKFLIIRISRWFQEEEKNKKIYKIIDHKNIIIIS